MNTIERSQIIDAVAASPRLGVVGGWFPHVRCWLLTIGTLFVSAAFDTWAAMIAGVAIIAAMAARCYSKDFVVDHRVDRDGFELVRHRSGRRALRWSALRRVRVGVDEFNYVLEFEDETGRAEAVAVTGLAPIVDAPAFGARYDVV